jgi:sugar/nucleoside kinase (ribokinase family)
MPTVTAKRKGILCAGHWIVDHVKTIDTWPAEESLARIKTQSSGNGGCAYNVAKDLARLDPDLPVYGAGLIGKDPDGDRILADCRGSGIQTDRLVQTGEAPTAYTDVMTVASTGRRTFFYNPGTNDLLEDDFLDLQGSAARILHLGYLGLLERLDCIGRDGLTGCARLLKAAARRGLITSTDLVSVDRSDLPEIVFPALPYLDVLFLNEFEAGRLLDRSLVEASGKVSIDAARDAVQEIVSRGVRRSVILHFPEGVVAAAPDGALHAQSSVRFPAEEIAGTVGAGDAFAAGVLYGIHEGWTLPDCLELGVCAAAQSLRSDTASDAILPWKDSLEAGRTFGFQPFPT